MKISLLIPTRKRPQQCLESIQSVVERLAPGDECEPLLYVDRDDEASIDVLGSQLCVVGPRLGYAGLHKAMNCLASLATGDWLWLWNDDVVMTAGTTAALRDLPTPCIASVAKCELHWVTTGRDETFTPCDHFPIISRDVYEAMGHFSLHPACDTYLFEVATRNSDICAVTDIELAHYAVHDDVRNEHGVHHDGTWPLASRATERVRALCRPCG